MNAVAQRISALDAFRGLAILAMVLVNNPGSWGAVFAPLQHARWHGLTPTDVIFPGFIFIMGVTIAIHLPKELARLDSRKAVLLVAVKRGMTLILLGWGLQLFWFNTGDANFNWINDRLLDLRFMGVLPRLGLVYCLTVAVLLWLPARWLTVVTISLLLAYWSAMTWVPYCDETGQCYRGLWLFGNSLSAAIDQSVLGSDHLYYGKATPFAFDPEGLLSTIPAVVSCLSGVIVGRYVLINPGGANKLLTVAIGSICSGFALAVLNPINKALWSPTFVLVTSGMLTVLLWLFLLFERKRGAFKPGNPLLVAGTNSIAFFMLSGVLARILLMIRVGDVSLKTWLYEHIHRVIAYAEIASLMMAGLFMLVCYLPIWWMYRQGIFWRI